MVDFHPLMCCEFSAFHLCEEASDKWLTPIIKADLSSVGRAQDCNWLQWCAELMRLQENLRCGSSWMKKEIGTKVA